jgi:hypothetical protein
MIAKRQTSPRTSDRRRSSPKKSAAAARASKSPTLFALIGSGFDALRARVSAAKDPAAAAPSAKTRSKAEMLEQLERLRADYERVLKRE